MNLREISAALQRGESLTDEQKALVLAEIAPDFAQGDYRFAVFMLGEDPFTSLDAALAFVAEVFPKARVQLTTYAKTHSSAVTLRPAYDEVDEYIIHRVPTPSAALMAAAIEAHLAKAKT